MARSSNPNPFGKLTEEVRCEIDEQTKDALVALAVVAGKPMSAYLRDLLQLHVHGHLAVLRSRMEGRE